MGFASGFTGGVTLTLSVAYLSALAHQRNRENQGAALRAQALALNTLIDPLPEPLPPTRSEAAAAQRATAVEFVKDRWNQEVESAVRWAQNTDWDEVRDSIETRLEKLWSGASGETSAQDTAKAVESSAASKAKEASGSVADTARTAYLSARRRVQTTEEAAENKALEARLRANRAASKAEDTLASAWETGKEKAKDLADKAKAAVEVVEERLESKTEGEAPNPVELALRQRYEKAEKEPAQTVAEALRERYIPLSERDNTVLRGL